MGEDATCQRKTLKIRPRSQIFFAFIRSALSCLKWSCAESKRWFKSGLEEKNRAVFCQGVYRVRICHPVFRQT